MNGRSPRVLIFLEGLFTVLLVIMAESSCGSVHNLQYLIVI